MLCSFKALVINIPGEHWQNRLLRLYKSITSFTATSPVFIAVIKEFGDINNIFLSIFLVWSATESNQAKVKVFQTFQGMSMCVQIARLLFYTFSKNPGLNSQTFQRMGSCFWGHFSPTVTEPYPRMRNVHSLFLSAKEI